VGRGRRCGQTSRYRFAAVDLNEGVNVDEGINVDVYA